MKPRPPSPLTSAELGALEHAARDQRDKLILWTLLDTGLRVSELCNLKRFDMDYQGRAIRFAGKGNKERVVPLSSRAYPLIAQRLALQDRMRLTPRTVQRVVRAAANRAGLTKRVSPHVLRHTFSVEYLRRGGSLRALQLILGHATLDTTEIYLRLSGADVLDDYRRHFEG